MSTTLNITFIGKKITADTIEFGLQSEFESSHFIKINQHLTQIPNNLKKCDGLIIDTDHYQKLVFSKDVLISISKLREDHKNLPIIVLSKDFSAASKEDNHHAIALFKAGIDDGFDFNQGTRPENILAARFKNIMRRYKTPAPCPIQKEETSSNIIEIDGIKIDPQSSTMAFQNNPVKLTETEFNLLHFLAGQPDVVFNRNSIMDAVHGNDAYHDDRTIDSIVKKIRSKASTAHFPEMIKTIYGRGFTFMSSSTRAVYTRERQEKGLKPNKLRK